MVGSASLVRLAYLTVPAVTIGTGLVLMWYVYRQHWDERGAKSYLLTLGVGFVWLSLLITHILLTDPMRQRVVASAEFVTALVSFAVFCVFVSQYTGRGFHHRLPFQVGFGVVVVGLPVLTLTNPWHGLIYADYQTVSEPFHYVRFDHSAGWVLVVAVLSMLVAYSSFVLVRYLLASAGRTGMQLVMLLTGVFCIPLLEVLGRTGVLPADGFHHAAYGTSLFIVLSTFALFRFRLLDIQPVARNAVVETLQDPVVMLDSDRRVVDANREANRVWPALDDHVGDSVTEACPFLADAIEFPSDRSRTTARLTLPVGDDQFHYSVQVSAVRRGDGDGIDWYAIVLRDVTELEQSRWQLQKQNERLDQVAATISHDLRNPITVADGYLEVARTDLLAEDDPDPGTITQARDYLADASGSLARMEQIIDDVLTLAREGQTVSDTDDLDLRTVAEDAWDNVATERAALTVRDSRTVEADRGRLLTIFENLMRNALDHGPDDVTIEVGTTETGFYVADDGPGIPESDHEDVFEYGYTTDDDGTGLGLSIVRTMAESHGWTVTLDPDHDDGARFEFDITGEGRTAGQESTVVTPDA